MCNEAARRIALHQLREDWSQTRIPLRFPEGLPNMGPADSIRITDPAPIIRIAAEAPGEAEMVTRRWSWPAPTGKPVYNYRSDGREFKNGQSQGRCLIPVDTFYEFTAPPPGQKLKSKWACSVTGLEWFCIAGLWRAYVGADGPAEAWTMLTTEPGPDIAPYHSRQVVVLTPRDYGRWLDGSAPASELCRPLPGGMLGATQVR